MKNIRIRDGAVYREEGYPSPLFAKDGEVLDLDGKQAIILWGGRSMKTVLRKKTMRGGLALFWALILLLAALPVVAWAREVRTVRVAFFPMQGYHTYSEAEGYDGVDVAYLKELCTYTGWKIEYVDCASWDEALSKLEAREVDLVGSAQYSRERAETFDYAALASGYTYGCLFVEEDSEIAFEDFADMRDMKFGVVESYVRKPEFLEYLSRNGIEAPNVREYGSTKELQEGVGSGEVDIGVHTLTEVQEGQCLVGKFAYAPYYYITWKGNEELLSELNRGIEAINMDSSALDQELTSRYYGDRRENFAAEERKLIEGMDAVRIGFYEDTSPLAYVNKAGEYDGIYIRILKAASERSGIPMEFVPLDRSQYWKELLLAGNMDFYVGANSMQLSRDEDIMLTGSFMAYNAVIVSRNDYVLSDEEPTMVLTRGRAYWADEKEFGGEVIYRESAKDCLCALEDGEADVTLLNTIEYNYQSKNERFSNLIEWGGSRYQSGSVLAASGKVDQILFDVMNKALRMVSEEEKEDIINQYMNISYSDYDLYDYLYQTKDVLIIAGFILAFGLVFACSVFHMRRKSYLLLKKKNLELQAAMREAEKASRAKTEFLSHMSHDMRTPINGIMGMLNIAEKNPEDGERQEDCRKKIRTSAEHLLSLVNDVLDINKLESENVEFAREAFDLRELLGNCMTIAGGQAQAKKVRLTADYEEVGALPHPYVLGSPLHIKQVLVHIMGNAVKYNKPMGSVHLVCREISVAGGEMTAGSRELAVCDTLVDGGGAADEKTVRICFKVSDTGTGMNEAYLEHIFEPFTQEAGGARTDYRGAGLGMAITKKLVEGMGGTIDVKSEAGKGSVVTVVLPLEIANLPEPEEDRKTDSNGIRGKRALVVEDNELNREIAEYMMEENGLEVTLAENGQEAVELFERSEPGTYQIVFMDIMMPVMDGHEATKAIRGLERPDAKGIPIIAMTANAFAEDVQASRDAGMNEHMAKPLKPEMISEVLERWLTESGERVE